MPSVEVSHNNIINLFKIIADAIKAINELNVPLGWQYNEITKRMTDDEKNMRSAYLAGASSYIVAYYGQNFCAKTSLDTKSYRNIDSHVCCYWDFVSKKGIISKINGCMHRLNIIASGIAETHTADVDKLMAIIGRHVNYRIEPELDTKISANCECGGQYVIYADSCEKKCKSCGMTSTLYGAVFDDAQMYGADGVKIKQGRHYPCVHCRIWIARIQAWSGPEIPSDVFRRLRQCCKRDNTNMKKMRCAQIRKYLKEQGLTAYNNFIPYIRKILTGIAPPQLTMDELDKVYSIFNKIVAVLKKMRPDNNITYYPGIIYKILVSTLPDGKRKAQILECIHLQSNKTMRLIDNIYEQLCPEIDELVARPTNRHEYKLLL